ncbi:putative sulfide quinone reductase, partial [Operophtera brumata]
MNVIRNLSSILSSSGIYRSFSVSAANNANYSCKLLVVGGGSGGCTMAAKFARRLGKDNVIVLEPSPDHYYQPLFTLVGAGVKRVSDTHRHAHSVLPVNAKWVQDKAEQIDPDKNKVMTAEGHVINYEYIIIAVGLCNDFCKSRIHYNTCLPVIFGVKKYADALLKVVERKDIKVNYRSVLLRLFPDKKEAVFVSGEDRSQETTMKYDMLHVTPPMKTPDFLSTNQSIVDKVGFLDVDKYTLQHTKYKNMYGIGDCTNTPNSKTAAAIAKQSYVVEHNLLSTMQKDNPSQKYNGYGACPLLTSYNTCILAEFLYDGVSRIHYNTCLPVIFGVKKYADALLKVVERKDIKVNYRTVLLRLFPDKKEAVFVSGEDRSQTPDFLSTNQSIVDKVGFLDVDKYTLQHTKYKNMYGIGDCTNTPNSKTAAAIAKQSYVVEHNLLSTMQKDNPSQKYNGYGACPLLTSYNTCILAEFLYDGVVHETMPFDQAQESKIAFYMKKDLFPFMYWHLMLKGYYHGPEWIRKIINPLA